MSHSGSIFQHPYIQGIAFTHYPSRNLEVTLHFYRDVIGLPLLHHTAGWVEFSVGNTRLAFHKEDGPSIPPGSSGSMVWLEVKTLKSAMETMKNKGVQFIQGPDTFSYGKTAVFVDPNGNRLGLYEPPAKKR